MMTVETCISNYKKNTTRRITNLWICPEVVKNGKVGCNYTFEGSLSGKIDAALLNCNVMKHWIENDTLCIIYQPEGDPIIFS